MGTRFIDLSYDCQQVANGCKVRKKEISLVHYEDETVIGLASILYIIIYITILQYIFIWFRKTILISAVETHEEIIKGVRKARFV